MADDARSGNASPIEAGLVSMPDERPMRSLAERLTRRIAWLCVMATALVGLFRFAQIYYSERASFDNAVAQVSQTHLPLLSSSLWDIEPTAVQHLLQEIVKAPQIQTARLQASTGQYFEAADPPLLEKRPPPGGGLMPQGDVNFQIPGPVGKHRILGQLSLDFNHGYLKRQLISSGLRVLLVGGLLTLVFSGLTLRILRRELRQPLHDLARFAAALAPGKRPPPLVLNRPEQSHRDELDVVVDGFKTLRDDIELYVKERERRAEQLELAVARRTATLHEVTRYLESISRRSSRCLNLAVDEYPDMIRATLRDISSFTGHCSLAIAEQAAEGEPLICRFVWIAPHDRIAGMAVDQALLPDLIGPLQRGWSVVRYKRLADAEPARAQAMQRHGIQALVSCALQGNNGRTQVLMGASSRPEQWTFRDDRMAKMAAEMLFNIMRHWQDQLALRRLHQELEQRSNTDSLTGLANRRWFDELKLEETRRALRSGSPLALVAVDVDYFKGYNDNYGHAQGDQCLVAVSRMIQQTFNRAGEMPARVGGEEFTVLLPEHDLQQALSQAERLRQCVIDLAIPHQGSPLQRVSVSCGVACILPDHIQSGASPDQIIADALEAADLALYRAKKSGRNQVSS
ncbi:GGDEF domain-containing protein [Roseateles koreensis]|uniref:GGDEF domain-containing protein n=1 Tax=Roseateles koreensis TaxID=2987526 RepID=UPI0023598B2E|nr:GGDEF domain-containing protein [Roseateles koreensis]